MALPCHGRTASEREGSHDKRGSRVTDDERRIADLIELQGLCSHYMLLCSQFIDGRWLEVFTPDASYNVFGAEYTLDRFPALLEAAPRGQFIGNMPVVELDGD